MSDRIAQLRRAYFQLHEQVLDAFRGNPDAELQDLQRRELEIISELRQLGVHSPYEPPAGSTWRAC